MKKNSPNDLLDKEIELLESKRVQQLVQLKEQFQAVHASISPINIIKNTFKKVTSTPDLKNGVGKTALGVASGFLVKNILFRRIHNPFIKVAGTLIQTAVVGLVANNSGNITSTGGKVLKTIFSKFKK